MDKITYANKVDTRTTTVPEKNKVTASTLNQIKTIVNQIVDQVVLNLNELSNNVVKTTGNQSIAGDKTFTNDLAAPKLNFGYNTYYGRDMTISGIGDGAFDGIEVTNEFIIGKLANGTGDTALYFKYGSERVGGIYLDDDSSQHGLAFYVQESSTNSDIVKKISLREGTTIGNGLASTLPPENGLAVEGAATFASSVSATDGLFEGVNVAPATNPTTPTNATQITVGESSNNLNYNMRLGYYLEGGGYKSSIQSIAANAPANLVLNGDGGLVTVGSTLQVNGAAQFASSVSAADGIFSGDIIANQNIYTNGNLLEISAGGNGATVIQINDSQGKFTLNGQVEVESLSVSSLNTAPASATATGTTGQIKYTEDYIYVCTATNTWKRTAITTW